MEEIKLRPYQEDAVEGLRNEIRQRRPRPILCAPTGAGKTVIASYLMKQAADKGSRAAFIVDRVALVDQTSRMFADYGIPHGIAQSSNTIRSYEKIQVCSAQTIEKRGFWPDTDLICIDEAHTKRKKVVEFIQNIGKPVIGLTATPFSKGLGDIYTGIVNVTTTDTLIDEGYLAPLKVYHATQIDMTGAKTSRGEWTDKAVEERGHAIIGDIVNEWVEKTQIHFGGPQKTIVFSATVDHGAELVAEFKAAGFLFEQISYKDRNDDRRRELIEQFRNGDILGLVSCEALAKGFDVPDVMVAIVARPYRKSLASHIQMIGRGMRPFPGKEFCLLLDHAGNFMGFYDQTMDFFANGVDRLDETELQDVTRDEENKEKLDVLCSECGFILPPGAENCPQCGAARPIRKNVVETLPGGMVEVDLGRGQSKVVKPFLADKESVWAQLCTLGREYKRGDKDKALSWARGFYKGFYDAWPPKDWPLEYAGRVDPTLERHVKARRIRFAKGMAKKREHEPA